MDEQNEEAPGMPELRESVEYGDLDSLLELLARMVARQATPVVQSDDQRKAA